MSVEDLFWSARSRTTGHVAVVVRRARLRGRSDAETQPIAGKTAPNRGAKSAGGTAALQVYATDGGEALKLLGKSAGLKDDIACDLLFRDRLRAGVLINQNVSS
jgi:hypothetical protein